MRDGMVALLTIQGMRSSDLTTYIHSPRKPRRLDVDSKGSLHNTPKSVSTSLCLLQCLTPTTATGGIVTEAEGGDERGFSSTWRVLQPLDCRLT